MGWAVVEKIKFIFIRGPWHVSCLSRTPGDFLLAPFQNNEELPVTSGSPALSVAELFDGMVQRA